LAMMPSTCHVMWLVMSFFTAVRASCSASSCFGSEASVAGKGREE
jgi:hypothetical protein